MSTRRVVALADCFAPVWRAKRVTALGRQRWFVIIGCSRSAPKFVAIVGRMRERPLSQSLTFLAASAKVKFQDRPVVR
jgi:hypothetical protein